MVPSALVAILLLMHFHFIVERPAWTWVAVFGGVLAGTIPSNHLYRAHPSRLRLHLRILVGAAAVTSVIYLTGWGAVLVGAYAVLALDSISQDGSKVWPAVTFWSLVAICVGQLAIWPRAGCPPSSRCTMDNAMASWAPSCLVFIIRIAGAIMEKKEKAEASMGLSEDRFRSLIQNSSDTTLVLEPPASVPTPARRSPSCSAIRPTEMLGRSAADLVHPDDRDRVADHLRDRLRGHAVDSPRSSSG